MITNVQIDDTPEQVYNLESIGLPPNTELIITPEKQTYILSDNDYFELSNIHITPDNVVFKSEESTLKMSIEQFKIVEQILQGLE